MTAKKAGVRTLPHEERRRRHAERSRLMWAGVVRRRREFIEAISKRAKERA